MRRLLASLLVAALPAAAAPDGGLPLAIWAPSARLTLPDAGTLETGGPGAWYPEARLEAESRELANLRVQNAELVKTPPLFSTMEWAAIGVCAALGVLLGLFGGFVVTRAIDGHWPPF